MAASVSAVRVQYNLYLVEVRSKDAAEAKSIPHRRSVTYGMVLQAASAEDAMRHAYLFNEGNDTKDFWKDPANLSCTKIGTATAQGLNVILVSSQEDG
jgi:hypothetical protein